MWLEIALFMKKFLFPLLAGFCVVLALFMVQPYLSTGVRASEEVDELQKAINELEHLKQLSEAATTPLENEVKNLDSRIASARAGIAKAQQDAKSVEEKINEREDDLADQYVILSRRVHEQYKKARTFSPLLLVIQSSNAADLTKDLAYRNSVKAQDNKLIQTISSELAQLETDKAE